MKYRLIEQIGIGGMAEVFRAVGEGPEGFERPFVVKRIHPQLCDTPEFVRMFVDEAKISARLIHPNIIQVFEFGHQDGRYYIVMEPVEGIDMGWLRRQVERRREHLPTTFVAEIGRQACRGLDFAHTLTEADGKPLGIVHRDVTPPNIMAAWNGTVKILDFGLARAAEAFRSSRTDPGTVKGKMSYVAPELLDGKIADARSDVFSLGVVLHELLSGRQLFAGQNDLQTLQLVRQMPIQPPSAFNPGVKSALDRVVLRALERDPDKRYRSAGEMADDLEDLVLRKSYSPRALALKTRELFAREEAVSVRLAPAVSVSIGRIDSSFVTVEDGATRPPAGIPTRSLASGSRRFLKSRGMSLAVALPIIVAVAVAFVSTASRGRDTASRSKPAALPERTPDSTVRVVLDSVPQGAAATSQTGQRFGETPVLLTFPRGQASVDVVLTKPGFDPLVFKVIPHLDKDVIATLLPSPSTPAKVGPAKSAVMARHRTTTIRVSARVLPGRTESPHPGR